MEQNTDRLGFALIAISVISIVLLLCNLIFMPTTKAYFSELSNQTNSKSDYDNIALQSTSDLSKKQSPSAESIYSTWKSKYIDSIDNNTAVVNSSDSTSDTNNYVVTSESQGYGMLITAVSKNATLKDFNSLYNYYSANKRPNTQLMAWQQSNSNGSITSDPNNATDGDIFIAEALIQAAKRWPSESKTYLNQSKNILNDILTYNLNSDLNILTVSTWVSPQTKEWSVFRSSDVVPSFFDDFLTISSNPKWASIKTSMLKYMLDVASTHKGLVSDFITVNTENKKGTPTNYDVMGDTNSNDFAYNAIRVPLMLSMGDTSSSKELLNPLLSFLNTRSPIEGLYHLDGSVLNWSDVTRFNYQYAQYKLNITPQLKDESYPNAGYYTDTLFTLSRVVS